MKFSETREHLVRMVRQQGRSFAAAAHDLSISVRSATRSWAYSGDTGCEYNYDLALWSRHRDNFMDDPQLRQAVRSTVEEQPELFLDEISDAVSEISAQVDGAVLMSPSAVARVLTCSEYTRNVVELAFITRKEVNRVVSVEAQWQIPLGCRVYMDEAHRVGRAAERRWAWSLRGVGDELCVASSAGVRKSFFVAMANDLLLDWRVKRPSTGQTAVDFLLFLSNFAFPRMRSVEARREWGNQSDRCVLVLDSARIHDEVDLAGVREAGVMVLVLPLCSPDFNTIEDVFSVGSRWVRRLSFPVQ